MAIKVPTYWWFVNNNVRPLYDGDRNDYCHYSCPSLHAKNKKVVKSLIEKLDALHDSHTRKGKPLIKPEHHVILGNVIEIENVVFNRKRCAQLYEQLHGILRHFDMPLEYYHWFEKAVKEDGVPCGKDLEDALLCANRMRQRFPAPREHMNWETAKKYFDANEPAF